MRHAFCLLLTVGTLLAALVPVEAACPAIPIGVTVTTVNNDRQFLVTDRRRRWLTRRRARNWL